MMMANCLVTAIVIGTNHLKKKLHMKSLCAFSTHTIILEDSMPNRSNRKHAQYISTLPPAGSNPDPDAEVGTARGR